MAANNRRSTVRLFAMWIVLLFLALAGFVAWPYLKPTSADLTAALRANNHGVGLMDQFQFAQAVVAFEEVTTAAPGWQPGRINLGIALLNTATPESLERAVAIFRDILRRDPDNVYAHYCLGIIFAYQDKHADAVPHFEAVTRLDPDDAQAWYRLGTVLIDDSEKATQCFQRARELDPYLSGAIYALAMNLRAQDIDKANALLKEHADLRQAEWDNPVRIRYGEMGKYAEVIGPPRPTTASGVPVGPLPLFAPGDGSRVQLAKGTRWASRADFGKDATADLQRRMRERFGGVMVVLDYNRDGKPDLFLLGAVVEDGRVRDLLLRNDGGGRFSDVTSEVGLGGSRPSLGCCVADFDNNGYPDLFIAGAGRSFLFRNMNGKFEDVTAEAGLDRLTSVCLASAFVDLDQDGDLDLVVTELAATADEAVTLFEPDDGLRASHRPSPTVFLNVGEAPPVRPSEDPPPLKPRFRMMDADKAWQIESAAVGLTVTDIDGDRDLDLLVFADKKAPPLVLNDRLLRFHRTQLPEELLPAGTWNGGLVFDVNRDGRADLFVIGPGSPPVFLVSAPGVGSREGARFDRGTTNSPPLLQAQAVDLDADGGTDVVGLSDQRRPVLLHNKAGKLVLAPEALGRDADWPRDVVAVTALDYDDDGAIDVAVWSESVGLQLHRNMGNGNHLLKLELSGHRRTDKAGSTVRCNADGFGAWAIAQTDEVWTAVENTTLSAGLGQSRQALLLGLGRHRQADVVRLRWPDHCIQAEFNLSAGPIVRVEETNRKTESCPLLFAWDGRRFGFVSDFLGEASMGEALPGGGYRRPRPEESVKIEAHQLVPRDGLFTLKIAEPMNEVTYLDHLQLLVLDHPRDVRAYPDERFATSEPAPSQDLLAFRDTIFPEAARDHRGRDVLPSILAWDRHAVTDFARRSWLGFAEEHWIELDFGGRLAKYGGKEPLILCLAGWTDYPYPESIWAANQAGVALVPPTLERLDGAGKWQRIAEIGFPAGLPRMMTFDVTGMLGGERCRIRLRTNMVVCWDQIFVAPLLERIPPPGSQAAVSRLPHLQASSLPVHGATLAQRGCMLEFSPDGQAPTLYDYERFERVPVTQQPGRLTRFGEVTELLHDIDDRFVIFGPGDELTVHFAASELPKLPDGWTRSYVLRTHGYCKDCAPFTATHATVEPLPFRGMSNYPYGKDEHYPPDAQHDEYRRKYNTRAVGTRR